MVKVLEQIHTAKKAEQQVQRETHMYMLAGTWYMIKQVPRINGEREACLVDASGNGRKIKLDP